MLMEAVDNVGGRPRSHDSAAGGLWRPLRKKKVKRFSDNTPGNSFRSSADIFSTLPADAQQVALYRVSGGHGE